MLVVFLLSLSASNIKLNYTCFFFYEINHTVICLLNFFLSTLQPDRVTEFCKRNRLQLIIRAHECVMDGFERFAHGQLITLFSATNYCGMSPLTSFVTYASMQPSFLLRPCVHQVLQTTLGPYLWWAGD